ncbi:MAG: DNA (cytosine-5-)-methyltransferase [Gammaproteobacteria bacterium]|nr:DNA (cytosine-5-)-methyltransferase [Terriglobia bacterium]MYF30255.1 DNA (cytosine-5-)-methyltransferase [Gammaproteobacteria bacterium]
MASFFAGIGGFDLGFERAGFDVVFQCEIDPHCQLVLRRHWPRAPLHDDIHSLKARDIPYADVWTAGWPCQDLSAGHPQRAGITGERSGLFFTFMELVCEVRPRWIVMENVPGLFSADNGTAFESVIDEMEKVGYLGGWTTCNTLDFGLPQNRTRIFIVGSFGSEGAYEVLAHGSQLRRNHSTRGEEWSKSHASVPSGARRNDPIVVQRRGGFGYTREADICPTLRSQGGRHQGGHSDRPILCGAQFDVARMGATNGIPGRLDGRRGRLIGNAVAVPIAQWFAETIHAVEAGVLFDDGSGTK